MIKQSRLSRRKGTPFRGFELIGQTVGYMFDTDGLWKTGRIIFETEKTFIISMSDKRIMFPKELGKLEIRGLIYPGNMFIGKPWKYL